MSRRIEDKIQIIKDNQISEINLVGFEIEDHWAGKIAEALKVNSSLKIIDLFYNKFGVEGTGKIAEALKVNSSLQSIYLGGNLEMKVLERSPRP